MTLIFLSISTNTCNYRYPTNSDSGGSGSTGEKLSHPTDLNVLGGTQKWDVPKMLSRVQRISQRQFRLHFLQYHMFSTEPLKGPSSTTTNVTVRTIEMPLYQFLTEMRQEMKMDQERMEE